MPSACAAARRAPRCCRSLPDRWSACANCCATRSCLSLPDRLLADLAAAPRGTGTAGNRAARERCRRALSTLGFSIREQAFEFSAFPGKYATPLSGAAALILVGLAAELAYVGARRFEPAIVLIAGAIVLVASGRWLARRGVLHAPILRTRGVNVVATRGSPTPRLWLCAHIDTKSQLVPTLVRSAGIVTAAIGYVVALAASIVLAAGWTMHPVWWVFAALVTLVGAIPVMLSVTTFGSTGALDNASGVATVVQAASLAGDAELGVLITDAEELGLAGARAWSMQQGSAVVLNCDGVDDRGPIVAMYGGRIPQALLHAIAVASAESGIPVDTTRFVPGLLTDSVAFADAGIATVTFMRGTWRSLARVHSRRDNVTRLAGTGIAETARLMAHTLQVLERGDTTR